jgi:hypothetical protein
MKDNVEAAQRAGEVIANAVYSVRSNQKRNGSRVETQKPLQRKALELVAGVRFELTTFGL